MIRVKAWDPDGRLVIMLGLGPDNLRRMLAGDVAAGTDEPIRVNLRRLDPNGPADPTLPDLDVVIFSATPEAIAAMMGAATGRPATRPEDS